ncbi:MAG: hypothetical protein GOMPHAMPRED_003668 [Gomphillus americanus]|uniref:2,5-diamino-6-ribosylamino-4(3H)-pyrimidinone 5'-phosphate reductase n=1 Tax=Gomphillus americanus TaxID=1940652 RepID=A0A8H3FJE9_9LECA|nr:MAG: hypothetical protein GOMPHAMPRED_003668 [Gomphillus americanus]
MDMDHTVQSNEDQQDTDLEDQNRDQDQDQHGFHTAQAAVIIDNEFQQHESVESSGQGPTNKSQHRHDLSVLHNPIPFVAEMRKTLFHVSHPIELKVEEFHRYWPYVDNIWVRQHRGAAAGADKSGNKAIVDYYGCRLQRATYTPPSRKDGVSEQHDEQPQRKRRIRQGGTCRARLKIFKQEGLVACYRVQRVGDQEHSHDLDYIDKLKRNTVIMDIARSEVMKGFIPSSVLTVLQEDMAKLEAVGGKFLTRNDVRNASQRWRLSYGGKLDVHPSYRYNTNNDLSAGRNTPVEQAIKAPLSQQLSVQSTSLQPLPADTLFFPTALSESLTSHLPNSEQPRRSNHLPFITLTYASSLDSFLSLGPTIPTPISGPLSKAMTHHLRANHDAILIGVGTAIADNPTLNCRIAGAGGYGGLGWSSQPRPVIIDPSARWEVNYTSKILTAARDGRGKGPWIVIAPGAFPNQTQIDLLTAHGGKYITLSSIDACHRFSWEDIFQLLAQENIKSVMIEGGAAVINDLLHKQNRTLIDAVIITLAPMFLGGGGVAVGLPRCMNPETGRIVPALRFADVKWLPMDEDVVMCGRICDEAEQSVI